MCKTDALVDSGNKACLTAASSSLLWAAAIRSHGKIIGTQIAMTETLQAIDQQFTCGVDNACLSAASWSLVWQYCEKLMQILNGTGSDWHERNLISNMYVAQSVK